MRAAVIFVFGAVCFIWGLFARGGVRSFLSSFGLCLMVSAAVSGFAS